MHALFGNTAYVKWAKGNAWTKGNWRLVQIAHYVAENGPLIEFDGALSVDTVVEWVTSTDPLVGNPKVVSSARSKLRKQILLAGDPDFQIPQTKSESRKRRSTGETGSELPTPKRKRQSPLNPSRVAKRDREDFENRTSAVTESIMKKLTSLQKEVTYRISYHVTSL